MKKFISLLMILAGSACILWGGYNAFGGAPNVKVPFSNDFMVSSMLVGLGGVGAFTIGLIGYRD